MDKVTEEMIEAGAALIGGGSTFDAEDRREMAEAIYRAMRRASPPQGDSGLVEGPYRAFYHASRWCVEREFPCINGLSAWFVVATCDEASEAEMGYSEGAIGEARDRAEQIASALNAALQANATAPVQTAEPPSGVVEAVRWAISELETAAGVVELEVERPIIVRQASRIRLGAAKLREIAALQSTAPARMRGKCIRCSQPW